jgi:hypothetical protein
MSVQYVSTLQVASSRKEGKIIHSEAREMVNHVNLHRNEESVDKSLILPICNVDERTANYWGVSVATVKQIVRDSRERSEGSPPDKSRPRKTERNVIIDDFDLCAVKCTVTDFCVENKVVPTCKKLLPVIREKNHCSFRGEQSLRRIPDKIGFRRKNTKARESF